MADKETTSGQMVFAAGTTDTSDPVLAFSGVFPNDFSTVMDCSIEVLSFLVSKHLANDNGMSRWFDSLLTVDTNELVEIRKLGAKSIAELALKLDLHNLVWQ